MPTSNPASLPRDSALLPLAEGALLVSTAHATFCRVPQNEVVAVGKVMSGMRDLDSLGPDLVGDLERHGFFSPPREGEPDTPTVQLQLTNACNLSCGYCCTNSGDARAEEVSYERMLQTVREIPDVLGAHTQVAILGGEPLLVPWALDLAEEIVRLGLDLTVFTNGIPLAHDELARRAARLVQEGAKVRVSLAGPTRASCDGMSGAERFDLALQGIRRLADFGAQATVDLMLIPQHIEVMGREVARLRERLPAGTPITFGVLYMSGRETGEHLFPGRAELEAALDRIAFEAGEAVRAPRTSPLADRREGCSCALGRHVHVRSDGALFNCFKMEERVGDLETPGFAGAARAIRENPHRAPELATCSGCALATLCGGGCRSENLLYTGDPDVPPCGEWRVRVLSELLAEDRVTAVEWPVAFLLREARARGIDAPDLVPSGRSRHLIDV